MFNPFYSFFHAALKQAYSIVNIIYIITASLLKLINDARIQYYAKILNYMIMLESTSAVFHYHCLTSSKMIAFCSLKLSISIKAQAIHLLRQKSKKKAKIPVTTRNIQFLSRYPPSIFHSFAKALQPWHAESFCIWF